MIQRLLLTLALTVVVLLAPGGASARPGDSSSPSARAPVTTVVDTTLPGARFEYARRYWRVRAAEGRPPWLDVRHGKLVGRAPRTGTWKVRLTEREIARRGGDTRRTVLVLKSVTPRAATGTVLITRGIGGRPANADSRDVTVSGDGSTVIFSSRATNLVPGTAESAGRLYVWDTASNLVSLLHPEHWADLLGVSDDGRRVLVGLTAGLFLLDRTDGSATQVAERAVGAALTADGERVLYQDRGLELVSPEPQLLEWARATGVTRTVIQDVQTRTFSGLSADGRFALFVDYDASALFDTTTDTFGDLGRLGLEGGNADWVDVSDDGRMLSVRGSGLPSGSGSGGDAVAVVHDTLLGRSRGPARGNTGTAITTDGSHYAVATAVRHLRVVERATGTRTSPFTARPSGQETWASLSDDVSRVAYVSDGHDLLRGTRRGVANVYVWVRAR